VRILGVIPVRGGSKGIPGKNIKHLAGIPLVAYTFQSVTASKMLSKTIVSTDDIDIVNVCKSLGLEVPFIRPQDLAQDKSPTLPVLKHALDFLASQGEHFDAVCLLQVTSPFRESGLIDRAISKFIETDADALVSVLDVPHEFNPHWVFEPNTDGFLKIATGEETIISRRQELPQAFIRDGAIYLTKTSVIQQQNSLYGKKLAYIENKSDIHVNLDTLADWAEAEKLIHQFNNSKFQS
jgi:CMP-N,N'-diacetyllegionaminic acid synthase